MLLSPLSLSLLVHAISLSPASVPARGNQETIVTLDRAQRVVITASTPAGTSCEIVDHVRGPFDASGAAGSANCTLDLLLDSGTYKLRLASLAKGKGTQGKVDLKAQGYEEDNAQPVRLEPGREVRQTLAPRHQASYWLKLEQRQAVTLRVSGRTAGDVRLWRNGAWLEPVQLKDASTQPRAGQPQYEWWLEGMLDPGDYLVTAYGAAPKAWTEGQEDDTLSVAYGFQKAPPERWLDVTLPPWGLATVELPSDPLALYLSREGGARSTSSLGAYALSAQGESNVTAGTAAGCQIQGKALVPQCSTVMGHTGRHVALLRGEPGTRLRLQWAPLFTGGRFEDGSHGAENTLFFRAPATGEFLVGLSEVPLDLDSAPLGCTLEREASRNDWVPIVSDMLEVGPSRPYLRAFNYNGSGTSIWFKLGQSGGYVFSTSGERKSRCELFKVEGTRRVRLTQTDPKAETCRVPLEATPGEYELRLYGGSPGIERLFLGREGDRPKEDTSTRTTCLLPRVKLEQGVGYRLVTSRERTSTLRGLTLRPLPLTLSQPLPLVLDDARALELPLAAGGALEVRATSDEAFSCALGGARVEASAGRCQLPGTQGTLSLSRPGTAPRAVLVLRPPPPAAPLPALSAYTPRITPLPVLQPTEPAWFDFERGQSHSLTFDVKKEGLYHVTTLGLLATDCTIRTPVVQQVGSASGGGRGRNCLVATSLRPGRYLLTARTHGQSRGRGGVLLERREVKSAPSVRANGEVFFRAEAGDLLQQRLTLPRAADYALSSTAQGAQFQCRLDDAKGWPVVTVPTACTQSLRMAAGTYLWTQLPLTVESMRRTSLERIVPPVVLKGNKAHPVRFNAWYRAELGKDGKDEFSFDVPARLDVTFTLTGGMQGRLYALGTNGARRPVEVIPPLETPAQAPPDEEPSESYEPPTPSDSEESSDEPSESAEREEGEESSEEAPPPPPDEEPAPAARAESLPPPVGAPSGGKTVALEPGRYVLVGEHSRGDVAISYALYLRTDVFAPPMERDVDVPGRYALKLPVDGTLRLSTRGGTDVRCRLFDAEDKLVVENADRGADWNCALAEPLPAGDYTLVLESQTLQPGPTRVSVALAEVTDAGVLAEGGTLKVGSGVVRASLPPVPPESLQHVVLRAKAPFSCALEDGTGAVVSRRMDVRECPLLLKPGSATWRVRVWTLGAGTPVSTSVTAREARAVKVPHAGRYATGKGLSCLPAAQQGPLRPCGPEASLEAGDWVFGALDASVNAAPSLEERVDALDKPEEERVSLSTDAQLRRQRTKQDAVHLLRVGVLFGDPAYPACRLDGGMAQQRGSTCFAASSPTRESLARWWTPTPDKGTATVTRSFFPVPDASQTLKPGLQELVWGGGPGVRLVLPAESVRVQLSLPREAWALQVDGQGRTVDLCSPGDRLSLCVLSGTGGTVLLWSPAEPRAQAEVIAVEAAGPALRLGALFETLSRTPGPRLLSFDASDTPRQLQVTGASRCVATLDDGTRREGCDLPVPAGRRGLLLLELEPGGVRAVLAPSATLASVGVPAVPQGKVSELSAARALRLSGETVERTLTLSEGAVVHLRGDSGVCALARGATVLAVAGLDRGCAIDRLLEAGTYRLVVRGFAGQALVGNVTWTHEPVKPLAEGVASEESWVSPGQTRYFRFDTAAAGQVGLGLQVPAELLQCTVLDGEQRVRGEGCQQLLSLDKGSWLLTIRAPDTLERPLPFKPVLVGLAGTKTDVPEEYLRDFFQRIGAHP